MKKEWFATWFDTPYYHVLYKNRNDEEAKKSIGNLLEDLAIPANSDVLDLACGKGRHSVTLHNAGYNVLGVDLSENSIKKAQQHAKEGLSFEVHDMRNLIPNRTFDAVFNLFTSFGYFDDTSDNLNVLKSVHQMLRTNGILVIDFMNAHKVVQQLIPHETKEIDGIEFSISKRYTGSHILKDIVFEADNKDYRFTERVQALTYDDFESLLSTANFEILRTFGDFSLTKYDSDSSDRLIIVAQKK